MACRMNPCEVKKCPCSNNYIYELFHFYREDKTLKKNLELNIIDPASICFVEDRQQLYIQGRYFGISKQQYEELKEIVDKINPDKIDELLKALERILNFMEGTDHRTFLEYMECFRKKFCCEINKIHKRLDNLSVPEDNEISNLKEEIKKLKEEISNLKSRVGNALIYKGSVQSYRDLPIAAIVGDVYNVVEEWGTTPAGTNWAYNGKQWDALGGEVNLEEYVTKDEVEGVPYTENELNNILNSIS